MSRTRKDKPLWVLKNEATVENIEVYHRHNLFGQPFYSWVKKFNSDGSPMMKNVTDTVYVTKMKPVYDANGSFVEFKKISVPYEHVVKSEQVLEKVVVGYYPTECTAYLPEKHRSTDSSFRHTCYGWVKDVSKTSHARSRNNHKDKRNWNHKEKADVRSALVDAVKNVNTDDEDFFDEWDDVRVFKSIRPYHGH